MSAFNWARLTGTFGDRLLASRVWSVDANGEKWGMFTQGHFFIGERGRHGVDPMVHPWKSATPMAARLAKHATSVLDSDAEFIPDDGLAEFVGGYPWDEAHDGPHVEVCGLVVNPHLVDAVVRALGPGLSVAAVSDDLLGFRADGRVAGVMRVDYTERARWP